MIPGTPEMPAQPQQSGGSAQKQASGASEVRIYQHSPILYWWVVWAYGYFCALLTYTQGVELTVGEGIKPLLVHPQPWVGVSYVLVLLLVILATSVKARGVSSIFLLVMLVLSVVATYFVMNMEQLFSTPPSILVHMNLAFYMLVSTVLFVVWFVVVNIFDRLAYWRFRNAQIERVQLFGAALGRAPESYSVMHARLTRYSDDLISDKILSMGFLGLGTSDIDVKIAIFGGGNENFRIEHVWRATGPMRQVQTMMGPKATIVM
jgi:hypothetical protein